MQAKYEKELKAVKARAEEDRFEWDQSTIIFPAQAEFPDPERKFELEDDLIEVMKRSNSRMEGEGAKHSTPCQSCGTAMIRGTLFKSFDHRITLCNSCFLKHDHARTQPMLAYLSPAVNGLS
jgi:hypothetical protein